MAQVVEAAWQLGVHAQRHAGVGQPVGPDPCQPHPVAVGVECDAAPAVGVGGGEDVGLQVAEAAHHVDVGGRLAVESAFAAGVQVEVFTFAQLLYEALGQVRQTGAQPPQVALFGFQAEVVDVEHRVGDVRQPFDGAGHHELGGAAVVDVQSFGLEVVYRAARGAVGPQLRVDAPEHGCPVGYVAEVDGGALFQ